MALDELARDLATEIAGYDWTEAVSRCQCTPEGTPACRTDDLSVHVVRVVAQVLGHHDAALDLERFARACGVEADAVAEISTTGSRAIVSLLRRDELGGIQGPSSAAPCHVCDGVVSPADGLRAGRMRRVGVIARDNGSWAWGPVVVHEDCAGDLRTPLDSLLGTSFEIAWNTTPHG